LIWTGGETLGDRLLSGLGRRFANGNCTHLFTAENAESAERDHVGVVAASSAFSAVNSFALSALARYPADESQAEQANAAQQHRDAAEDQRCRPDRGGRGAPFFDDQHLVEVDAGEAVADQVLFLAAQRTHHVNDQALNAIFFAQRVIGDFL